MKEIKFRTWDKGLRFMIPNIQNQYCTDKNVAYKSFKDILESGNPIMQYTGLKDKNGKEIYEGDIVVDDEGLSGEITFSFGMFKFKHQQWTAPLTERICPASPDCEVIGNIYENKELLNE